MSHWQTREQSCTLSHVTWITSTECAISIDVGGGGGGDDGGGGGGGDDDDDGYEDGGMVTMMN